MARINSVLGPRDTDTLGFTLMHEHLLVSSTGISRNYPELLGEDFRERIVNGLRQAKAAGIDTIVDATTDDLGRDAVLMAEASRQSGVNIIATTGWWLDMPRFLAGVSADQFARLFTREIEEGIAGTDVRPGILKSASDMPGVTPEQETILRAVARAHHKTNAPIILHSYAPGQVGRQQLAILREEGVDPSRVAMGHANDTTDVEYLTWLLEQGCFLGMDRYPGHNASPLARTRTLKALLDAGYADRLLLSHDCSLVWGEAENALISAREMAAHNPHGHLYIKKVIFPQLREMGVSQAVLDGLCVNGPRNFLAGT